MVILVSEFRFGLIPFVAYPITRHVDDGSSIAKATKKPPVSEILDLRVATFARSASICRAGTTPSSEVSKQPGGTRACSVLLRST